MRSRGSRSRQAAIGAVAILWAALHMAACTPKPAPVCLRYSACQAAYDAAADHDPKDTSAYTEGGACWGDAATAARCAPECEEARSALDVAARAGGLDVPACAP